MDQPAIRPAADDCITLDCLVFSVDTANGSREPNFGPGQVAHACQSRSYACWQSVAGSKTQHYQALSHGTRHACSCVASLWNALKNTQPASDILKCFDLVAQSACGRNGTHGAASMILEELHHGPAKAGKAQEAPLKARSPSKNDFELKSWKEPAHDKFGKVTVMAQAQVRAPSIRVTAAGGHPALRSVNLCSLLAGQETDPAAMWLSCLLSWLSEGGHNLSDPSLMEKASIRLLQSSQDVHRCCSPFRIRQLPCGTFDQSRSTSSQLFGLHTLTCS